MKTTSDRKFTTLENWNVYCITFYQASSQNKNDAICSFLYCTHDHVVSTRLAKKLHIMPSLHARDGQ